MQLKLELITAVCENMGIGIQGNLPWRLNVSMLLIFTDYAIINRCRSEMEYFTRLTSTTIDPCKKNVVIMGRKTWESIPKKYKPLSDRINMVLSSTLTNISNDAIICKNLPAALEVISQPRLKDQVERIWVIGGSSIYKAALESPNFYRLYITKIKKHFECDTFFPEIPKTCTLVNDANVPEGIMKENGIEFVYNVYENQNYNNNV